MAGEGSEKILPQNRSQVGADFYDGERLPPAVEEVAEAYPAPSVSSRDRRVPTGWSAPVLTLEREAKKLGWLTSKAWAHGSMPHSILGTPGAPRDSYSVTFGTKDGKWQGYAIYAAGSWQSIIVAGKRLPPFSAMGRTDLSAWLAEPDREPSWYMTIRALRAQQLANTKARAACNRGVHDQAFAMRPADDLDRMIYGVQGWWCRRCLHGWAMNERPWRKSTGKGEAL